MANTYTSLHVHYVFSTQGRRGIIDDMLMNRLWAYIGGIGRQKGLMVLKVGGTANHVHILAGLPPTMNVAQAIQLLKGNSSKWVHDTFRYKEDFAWQDGYGAFTVSKSAVVEVERYISHQDEHHRQMTFEEEYIAFLQKHGIEFDERYVVD